MKRLSLIDQMLEGKKSFVSHIVHDEIVIDYSDEDRDMVLAFRDIFEDGYMWQIYAPAKIIII